MSAPQPERARGATVSAPRVTGLGASSTSALASFGSRPVTARTTLMTWIFLSPGAVMMTSTVLDSSSAAAAPCSRSQRSSLAYSSTAARSPLAR
jgi:hypothetical protein